MDDEAYLETIVENMRTVMAEIRTSKGMSQGALAKKMGIPVQQVSAMESSGNPTVKTLAAFARALDVEVADLFRPPSGADTRLAAGRPRKPT